jgi:preprotein translocase subunit SecE
VTWPTSKELASTAVLVLSASIIIALIVFGINFVFEGVVTKIYELIS